MRFRVLGPLEVDDEAGRPVALGGAKQRLLLAALLSRANRPVSLDQLLDALWDGAPPPSGRKNLQTYIHRLRRTVGDSRIVHDPGGYAVVVESEELDTLRFERRVADGHRSASDGGDLTEAAGHFTAALRLWRGDAYAGIADCQFLTAEIARLTALRLDALVAGFDAELALGRHLERLPELARLVERHPTCERGRRLLMLALYRSGRTTDALESYQDLRRRTVEELGVEPSAELRDLQQAILRADPALDLAPGGAEDAAGAGAASASAPPTELPPGPEVFTGRRSELDRLTPLLAASATDGRPTVVAINGPGGIGKSTLAVQVARSVTEHFPDGQLYVDLRGATPGLEPPPTRQILGRFLRVLGVDDKELSDDVEEAAARFRSLVAGRRLLIVLDNAAEPASVHPLLPGSGGSAVIVTSRQVLSTLEGAVPVGLGVLTEDEAVELLRDHVGSARADDDPAELTRIARLCGLLPLALRIAGARLVARPELRLAGLADRLADAQSRLDELAYADLAVRTSCAVSYQALPEPAARLFDLLGVLDLPTITVPVAAELLGVPATAAYREIDRLVDDQLLRADSHGRYALHDLLRLYARERAAERLDQAERDAAIRRVLHHYLATARTALRLQTDRPERRLGVGLPESESCSEGLALPDGAAVQRWGRSESENLVPLFRHATRLPGEGPAIAAGLLAAVGRTLEGAGRWSDKLAIGELALSSAYAAGVPLWQASAHEHLGYALNLLDRTAEGGEHLRQALARYQDCGEARGEYAALAGLGIAHRREGDLAEATRLYERAAGIAADLNYQLGEASIVNHLARIKMQEQRPDEAIALFERSLELYTAGDAPHGAGIVLNNLGEAHTAAGRIADAVPYFERAIAAYLSLGQTHHQATSLWKLGDALHLLGRGEEARDSWRAALERLAEIGRINADRIEEILAEPVPQRPPEMRDI